MDLLILAGGFGTRLQSVLSNTPKALAPINGIPFLELQIDNWIKQGINSFIFLLHYEAQQIIAFLEKQKKIRSKKITFKYIVEDEPLDTGGAILNALSEFSIKNDFLVINADTWLETGFQALYNSVSPSILVVSLDDCSRYGSVKFDKNLKVEYFEEKSSNIKKGYINAGLVKLSPSFFAKTRKKKFSLERDIFPELVRKGLLSVKIINTFFIDIGIPKDYKSFCEKITRSK